MVAGTTSRVFFNEIHYDNAGSDVGEFIEIANTAEIDLTGWTVVLYNATGGGVYGTFALSGSDPFFTLTFPTNGIQNGTPDGFALVDPLGNVVQFLSYEGVFTATEGPAVGMTSTDIGVAESGTTPIGYSLQLEGTGETYGDFTWASEAVNTAGVANNGQTIAGPPEPVLFINEIHYDNASGDVGEFVEVAGSAGFDLTGYQLVLYNGNGGAPYNTLTLSGVIDDEGNGFGAVSFAYPANGIQNGSPDAVALVAPDGTVLHFLSYEGSFVAVGGPADGMTSTDIGVSENGTDPIGNSLQLKGNGSDYPDFAWSAASAESPGSLNAGQTFGDGGPDPLPGALSIDDVSGIEGNAGTTEFTFTVTRSGGSDGAVSADWSLVPGTADAADFADALSGTVSFADGETTATITIAVTGDTASEGDETFTIELSNPQGGVTLDDASGAGTIVNDDVDDTPVGPAQVFINEVHYDNAGGDVGERIEIAGPAGTDLSGWTLVLYNGNGGGAYRTINLAGTIADQDDGFGTLSFDVSGIQNGSPDGFALVDPAGRVIQFLSYEGTLTATDGPANGMTSTDIGVAEDGGTPGGFSVQLTGSGNVASDFTWTSPTADSFGAVNAGQDFTPANPNGTLYLGDASVTEGDSGTSTITFNVFRVGGTDGAVTADYVVVFGPAFSDADAADFAGATSGTVSFADGQSFATITLEVAGDVSPEPNEFFDLVLSNATGGANVGDAAGRGAILNDDPLDLLIGEIQGAGHRSDYVDNEVTTRGIVTAVTDRGFYLQDAGDGNTATSDAIYVFTGSAPTVAVGDGVTVTGNVVEFLGGGDPSNLTITELVDPVVTVTSSGNALPQAVLIGPDGITPPTEIIDDDGFAIFDPENDGIDFWESLEGMRVTIQNPVAVDSTNGFGELWTVASDGEGNLAATNVSDYGLVVLDGGEGGLGVFNSGAGSDFNPERIQIDVAGALNGLVLTVPEVLPGATLNDVTGIVEYSFGNYEVRPTEEITIASASDNADDFTTLSGAENQLTVATYNVLNLDINDADGDQDVASGRFDAIAFDIAVNLNLPDIVVLEEVQDDSGSANDGTVSAQLTLQALADAIFAESGVRYSVFDNPFVTDGENGGQPGGNIRVAFLYRDDRVDFDESSAFTITDPEDGSLADAFVGSRPPLGGVFTFNGEQVTVIGNHFTSKIGSDNTFSANQPPANAGALARAAQAAAVNAYIDALLALNPDANVVVAGDFNEFHFEEPMKVLTGELDYADGMVSAGDNPVLTNLTYFLAPEERYSVLFQGNAQQLDHILATGGLASGAVVDVVHTNIPTGGFAADHDPVLARFNIGSRTLEGGNGSDAIEGNDGNDIIRGGNGEDAMFGRGGDDMLYGDNGADWLFGGAGDDELFGGNGPDWLDGGSGMDRLTGGNGPDTFVIHADGTAADADVIVDFSARGSGKDTIFIAEAEGRAITFVQAGADTQILADGQLIATVLGSSVKSVSAAVEYDGGATAAQVFAPSSNTDMSAWHDGDYGRLVMLELWSAEAL